MSLTQWLAECMRLDYCDAVRYATECEICAVTSARNEGDIDLGLWFVDMNTSNCKYEQILSEYPLNIFWKYVYAQNTYTWYVLYNMAFRCDFCLGYFLE